MKTLSKIIALMLISNVAYSQCKYTVDEVDKFTQYHVLETKGKVLWMNIAGAVGVIGKKVDDLKVLKIYISGHGIFSILEGQELDLLTTTGEVHTLTSIENVTADYHVIGGSTVWMGTIAYYAEDYDTMIGVNYETLRVHVVGNTFIEREIKAKYQDNISKVLECIK